MNSKRSYPIADAVRDAYRRGEEDEAMEPVVLEDGDGRPLGRIGAGDYVIFYDIRGEREIQLTQCFTDPSFSHFPIPEGHFAHFVTMIEYAPHLDVKVAFPPLEELKNTLCHVVSGAGRKQVKVVETEKAVHLSFYLNGKGHEQLAGERRNYVPSPAVDDYGQHPRMQIDEGRGRGEAGGGGRVQ